MQRRPLVARLCSCLLRPSVPGGFSPSSPLSTLRKKKGLTQKELAEKAHTSQSAIARLESSQHENLTLAFLQKVSHALGLAPEIRFHEIS